MKHGTTPTLAVNLALTPEEVQSISFAFRSSEYESAPNLLVKCWPEEECITYDRTHKRWLIVLTSEETWNFRLGEKIFMDVRPVLANGCVPDIAIISLGAVTPSFFAESCQESELVPGDPDFSVEAPSANLCYGADGGYYIPSVDENANLIWTASRENMPAIEPLNIYGCIGRSITASDDGDGNVTLALSAGIFLSDDGAGNLTIS